MTCRYKHSYSSNSKAKGDIRNPGITPKKVPKCVRKKVVIASAILEEIKALGKKDKKQRVCGKCSAYI